MKVHYVNSFASGTQHKVFNGATLYMFAELFPAEVHVYSVPSSECFLKTIPNAGNVASWKRLWVCSINSLAGLGLRYVQSALCNVWVLLKAKPVDLVVYNFNNVFSSHVVDILCRCFRRNVLVFCHNELEYITNSGKHSSLQKKVLSRLTNSYFSVRRKQVAKGLRFVVLGGSILRNLRPVLSPEMAARFWAIDHPVTTSEKSVHHVEAGKGYVNIGTVGIVNYYKGASELVNVVKSVSPDSNVRFSIVGSVQGDVEPVRNAGITLPPNPSVPMPDSEFQRAVAALDFILLLYPHDTYRLMASGAVLDALRFEKPIIALRTDYFEYLFKKFGKFGYLANDTGELLHLIEHASELSRDFPFRSIAGQLSPQALLPELKKITSSFNYK